MSVNNQKRKQGEALKLSQIKRFNYNILYQE